jgi:hypothetical protein
MWARGRIREMHMRGVMCHFLNFWGLTNEKIFDRIENYNNKNITKERNIN